MVKQVGGQQSQVCHCRTEEAFQILGRASWCQVESIRRDYDWVVLIEFGRDNHRVGYCD